VRRGDIYALRLPKGVGHEQYGERYGVVVQSDAFLPRSVVLIAPTSRSARAASFRPEVEIDGVTTRVLGEQVGAVDAGRLGDLVGHLTPQERWGVDAALLTVLGLD
jgi:mRNA interferase MazF